MVKTAGWPKKSVLPLVYSNGIVAENMTSKEKTIFYLSPYIYCNILLNEKQGVLMFVTSDSSSI